MPTLLPRKTHSMYSLALFFAPLFQALSSFFWINGEYGTIAGILIFLSTIFWIPALIALFSLVKSKAPNYAAWGLLVAIAGFISGANFAMVGVFAEIFAIPHDTYIKSFSDYPVATNILLFWPGPLAPLSLVVLGIMLWRTKSTKTFIAILIIAGGIAFPLSRITRIEWVAHVSDTLLLVPVSLLGLDGLVGKSKVKEMNL